jgi:hypothetical protein
VRVEHPQHEGTHNAPDLRPGLEERPARARADARAGGRQIEEGRFAELSNALVLPPVDDLRQAALYLPYALLPSDADAALAAKARRAQRGSPVVTCTHSLIPRSVAAPACTADAARRGHMPALLQGQLVPHAHHLQSPGVKQVAECARAGSCSARVHAHVLARSGVRSML